MLKTYWLCTDGRTVSAASSSGTFLKTSLNSFKIVCYIV